MPRAPRTPVTLDPAFRAACVEVLAAHRGRGHVFSPTKDGGTSVSCYVWVSGPSTRKGRDIRALLGGFDLDLTGGKVYAALRAIRGCSEVSINLD